MKLPLVVAGPSSVVLEEVATGPVAAVEAVEVVDLVAVVPKPLVLSVVVVVSSPSLVYGTSGRQAPRWIAQNTLSFATQSTHLLYEMLVFLPN
jgi:hypothetical protein